MIFNLYNFGAHDRTAVAFPCRQIQVKQTKLYLLKLLNRISSPSSCISETACLIVGEISLFVTSLSKPQEAILLVTYASLASLARRNGR